MTKSQGSMEGLFTSESVSEGHPDKIADQIADAILDAIISVDPLCRVACDVLVKNNCIIVAGEITTKAKISLEEPIRSLIRKIGYDDPSLGFDADSCNIQFLISNQSPDIAAGMHDGAGDQGSVFGYACRETDVLMPAPIFYAHQLVERQADLRKKYPFLKPDAKSQVTFRYENDQPCEITALVLSTQHTEAIHLKDLVECVHEEIIKPIIPSQWLTKNTRFFINSSGRFVLGGPIGDCGLTGRKIAVDSYGGMARDGGGCLSGKDPSKLDRSGAYAARFIAKNIIASGLASRCEIQISYAMGVADPLSIYVDTFGTGNNHLILDIIKQYFDVRPHAIIKNLDLLNPIYLKTAVYGHFGRPEFSWEKTEVAQNIINGL